MGSILAVGTIKQILLKSHAKLCNLTFRAVVELQIIEKYSHDNFDIVKSLCTKDIKIIRFKYER